VTDGIRTDDRPVPPHNVAALVHLVGFLTGAALYAMLFGLVLRRRMPVMTREEVGDDRLPLVTAILGLVWNLSGLAAIALLDFAGRDPHPLMIALAYSALGFLPAVVVHSVLRGISATFIRLTYAISTIAAALMVAAAVRGEVVPSIAALQTLTWAYVALTIPVVALTRKRADPARQWSIVALAVFAVSALHLSHGEGAVEPWFVELLGHHASVPLIFAILYQDFRFALADLFLKRALALFALVALASGLYLGVQVPLLAHHHDRADPIAVGGSVILWAGTALLYPLLRRGTAWIVERIVLHRVDYLELRRTIGDRIDLAETPEAVMDALTGELRLPLAANEVRWIDGSVEAAAKVRPDRVVREIPTTEAPRFALVIGSLAGGRTLLSDDVALLDGVSLVAARRIDALRLARERFEQRRVTAEAELRALRAQVNPHFLFNALNTIGYLIQTSPARAHVTLMRLTALLRGVLRSADATTTLGDEIDLVSAYLDIERARFEERLQITIAVPDELRGLRVPPLLIQPLVENAIKHGIANSRGGGLVAIESHTRNGHVAITVRNSGATASEDEIARGRRDGVGLANLDARLRHHYGGAATLTLVAHATETCAEIVVPNARRA
jgi:two-component system LytT family sensor kinase